MTHSLESFATLSDRDLLAAAEQAAIRERSSTAELIALLVHVDGRRLYLSQGCSSLFTYCTRVLHLSEHAAYGRIEAARAARRFPAVLDALAEGAVNLTTIALLAPHLTVENHERVLHEARHQSKRGVEHLVARLRPQPDAPTTVRKLPARPEDRPSDSATPTPGRGAAQGSAPTVTPPATAQRGTLVPTAPERYKVQISVSRETHDKLRRLQNLLRHSIPNGDIAAIVDRALTVLLADVERVRHAATEHPRACGPMTSGSRHIPAAVRRDVWKRDGGQCAFVGGAGRCTERGFLEFHHVEPYAVGGPPSVENIQLRCRAHNLHEAEVYFGNRLPLLVREEAPAYECSASDRSARGRRASRSRCPRPAPASSASPDRSRRVAPHDAAQRGVRLQRRRIGAHGLAFDQARVGESLRHPDEGGLVGLDIDQATRARNRRVIGRRLGQHLRQRSTQDRSRRS
jgi:5-methylcytosine-specific restriction endonuclease McrA